MRRHFVAGPRSSGHCLRTPGQAASIGPCGEGRPIVGKNPRSCLSSPMLGIWEGLKWLIGSPSLSVTRRSRCSRFQPQTVTTSSTPVALNGQKCRSESTTARRKKRLSDCRIAAVEASVARDILPNARAYQWPRVQLMPGQIAHRDSRIAGFAMAPLSVVRQQTGGGAASGNVNLFCAKSGWLHRPSGQRI